MPGLNRYLRIVSMFRIKSAQYDDGYAREQDRARGVEESYQERYLQGNEEYVLWATGPRGNEAISEPMLLDQLMEYIKQVQAEYMSEGYRKAWITLDGEFQKIAWEV